MSKQLSFNTYMPRYFSALTGTKEVLFDVHPIHSYYKGLISLLRGYLREKDVFLLKKTRSDNDRVLFLFSKIYGILFYFNFHMNSLLFSNKKVIPSQCPIPHRDVYYL